MAPPDGENLTDISYFDGYLFLLNGVPITAFASSETILRFENILGYQKILTTIINCVCIAVISNIGVRLKLWVGMANLYFLCLHIILDWQKQYNKSGSVDFKC